VHSDSTALGYVNSTSGAKSRNSLANAPIVAAFRWFEERISRFPDAAYTQYGGSRSSGGLMSSVLRTAAFARRGSAPSFSTIRSMHACWHAIEFSDRASGSGAPEVPPVLSLTENQPDAL